MKDKIQLPKLELGSLEKAGPLLAVLLLIIGLVFVSSGVRQWWAGAAEKSLFFERDRIASDAGRYLHDVRAEVVQAVSGPELKAPLAAGDSLAIEQSLAQALPKADEVRVYSADLQAHYDALPGAGYSRLAVVEAVLAEGTPVMRVGVVGDGKSVMIGLPLEHGQVALVSMPVQPLLDRIGTASAGQGYLALRQGSTNLIERGDRSLADVAESRAAKISETDLRIAAGAPVAETDMFDLGTLGSLLIGVLALIGAGAVLVWSRRRRQVPPENAALEHALTLDELAAAEASDAPPLAADSNAAIAAAPNNTSIAKADAMSSTAFDINQLDAGMFRAYDIRGVVGKGLNADVARMIGRAIGSQMQEQGLHDIVVGRDGRLSGPELAGALIEGLIQAGCRVTDIGLAPTPLVYFAAYHLRAGSCVAVTGSHNPPDYNGFKIVIGGETLSGDAITALYARIVEGRLHRAEVPGSLTSHDVAQDYVDRIATDIQVSRSLKVVVDAGNGAAGELGPRVLEAIGAEVIQLYCEIDGNFPNHHPDPSDPHNLEDLTQAVQRTGADIGLAFDGDGDRLGVVTPAGHNIFPDRLLMLFAADVLDRQPGAVIVYDVKCTGALMPWVLRHGGSPLMWKTGHSFIKAKMRETDAELAGEMSGHFFFKERWYGFDDGIYAAARLLEILSLGDADADTVFAEIPAGISTPEIKIPVDDPHAFIEQVVAMGDFEGGRSTTIDGLRADWSDGWGLVRASNTTPILVLRFEANDEAALRRIQQDFRERLLALAPGLEIPF
ncbi:MAG: phosphomannomutase/phosphoglucomutase [Pseudomonadota bacterium]|nr:phosphomannomutase/phosphoglucomutase [Pseudomonadota bacterium]